MNFSSDYFLPMALPWTIIALFALAFSLVEPSTCHVVKGSVSCLDCSHHNDLSGIRVLFKCDQVKALAMATTNDKGAFETELPSDASSSSSNCAAKLLGGPMQICSSKKNQVSKIVRDKEPNSFTISTPLNINTSCPSRKGEPETGSSMVADLPVPPEWGLPPSSDYLPVLPIIGIP